MTNNREKILLEIGKVIEDNKLTYGVAIRYLSEAQDNLKKHMESRVFKMKPEPHLSDSIVQKESGIDSEGERHLHQLRGALRFVGKYYQEDPEAAQSPTPLGSGYKALCHLCNMDESLLLEARKVIREEIVKFDPDAIRG